MLESHLTLVQKRLKLHSEERVVPSKKILTPTPIISHLRQIFEKILPTGAQVASEDVSTTQTESWSAQKHHLEKSPYTLNSTAIADNGTIESQVKTIGIHLK